MTRAVDVDVDIDDVDVYDVDVDDDLFRKQVDRSSGRGLQSYTYGSQRFEVIFFV